MDRKKFHRSTNNELIYTTTVTRIPDDEVNINVVKPVFRKRNGDEVKIKDMTDEEIQEAVHFCNEYLGRKSAEMRKMQKILRYLMLESTNRIHTECEELKPIQLAIPYVRS